MSDDATPQTLHGLFDQIVARYPHRTAVVAAGPGGGRKVSYAELHHRAGLLARQLADRGIGLETPVAIYLNRSPELIVAMLGVLKAGAAFVPVSPEYPRERIALLLADSGARAVIRAAGGQGGDELPDDLPVITVDATAAPTSPPDQPVHAPCAATAVGGDLAAYVIYTSGSTGRPKGVVVTHRNAIGLVRGQSYASFHSEECFLQLAPTSFDASAFEIWGALLSGARLVLPAASYQAIDELAAVVRENRITTLFLTPALFHELVRSRLDTFEGIRRVVVGGDVLSAERSTAFRRYAMTRPQPPILVNGYGPTETTTFALTHQVDQPDPHGQIPIGRPLYGARVYLLDDALSPVAPGAAGGIWIAGGGVSRGYLGRPGQTAWSFLPDPHPHAPGARMYRTGDLGRQRPDGTIEFLGRTDDQVKVRGFRIEPSEVELALLGLPGVRGAAVVAEPGMDGGGQLLAYVVAGDDTAREPAALRSGLAAVLPPYLIPSRFRFVDELVLGPSGKVDRAALGERATVADRPVPATAARPATPADDRRAVLAQVWAEVLGVDRVGPDDDFFVLGGDSMLAIRAIADAEARGVQVSLVDMFENPVLSQLFPPDEAGTAPGADPMPRRSAAEAPPAPGTLPGAEVTPLAVLPDGISAAYPATRLQLGLVFEAVTSKDGSLYHDVMAHRITAPLDEAALRTALDCVAATHEVLRTRFELDSAEGPRQLVEVEPRLPLVIEDLRGLNEEGRLRELERIAGQAGRPFDVERGPLLRVYALAWDDEGFRLVYGFHHAIMDGWSDTVFLTDLMTAYAASLAGETPLPQPATARFADFVALETAALNSRHSTRFWQEHCAGLTPLLLTPKDAPRTADRLRISHQLPADLAAGLDKASAMARLPLKSLIVATHLAALGELADTDQPVTGLAINGRPEVAGADRLMGLFLNIAPLTVPLHGPPGPGASPLTWTGLARRVFDAERAILEHRRFPYPAIRHQAGHPLFDVIVNFVHFRLWSELAGEHGGIRVDQTKMWDKTSWPLVVDFLYGTSGSDLRIDLTGDTGHWTAAKLDRVWTAHLRALTALAMDPSGQLS